MPSTAEPQSSPPNHATTTEDAIKYYKAQYAQLEAELADFQTSSRELEAELERDIEASEKRERNLKEKVEHLQYEADEWKTKCKQAKAESNTAQNNLQKEITTLRETNRTLQMKLRDIEVANDDFERQARHTTSSLEDMESKYNVAIERGVLLEEEIKNGEQERESLRIEAQRVRDELSDLKVETHITQDKLRKAEEMLASRDKKAKNLSAQAEDATPHQPSSNNDNNNSNSNSNNADHSPTTAASSPTAATPPSKSVASSSMASDVATTPPSPPFSEPSTNAAPKASATPSIPRARVSVSDSKSAVVTPHPRPSKPSQPSSSSRHSRGPSFAMSNGRLTPSVSSSRRNTGTASQQGGLPQSGSLYQIRGLIGKMQKLEQRVQSARSRLPAPVETPPRPSPRSGSALDQHNSIPSTVTMRSAKKRGSGSVASSRDGEPSTPYYRPSYSRASFGTPQATTPSRGPADESRPSSRTSMSSRYSASGQSGAGGGGRASASGIPQRSESRQSLTGRTPVGSSDCRQQTYPSNSNNPTADRHRPRSSLSNYNPSASMSYIDENGGASPTHMTPTPRRPAAPSGKKKSLGEGSGLPTPGFAQKRPSAGGPGRISAGIPRRESNNDNNSNNSMPPPERKKSTADLGETY